MATKRQLINSANLSRKMKAELARILEADDIGGGGAVTGPLAFNQMLTGTGGTEVSLVYAYSGTFPENGTLATLTRADDAIGTNPVDIVTDTPVSAGAQVIRTIEAGDDTKYFRVAITAKDGVNPDASVVYTDWVGPQVAAAAYHPLDDAVATDMIHLKLFFDETKVTELAGKITQIEDSYTTNIADRAVDSQRPLYTTVGGHKEYEGNVAATQELIEVHSASIAIAADSDLSTVIGCRIADITSLECFISAASGSGNGQYIYRKNGADLRIYMYTDGVVTRLPINHANFFEVGDIGNPIIITHIWTDGAGGNGTHQLLKNGVDVSPSPSFLSESIAPRTEPVYIGSERGTNAVVNGSFIGGIIQCRTAITGTQETNMRTYLTTEMNV